VTARRREHRRCRVIAFPETHPRYLSRGVETAQLGTCFVCGREFGSVKHYSYVRGYRVCRAREGCIETALGQRTYGSYYP
jgi:hypothetical protein